MNWWKYMLGYLMLASASGSCYGQTADSLWAKSCCYFPYADKAIERSDTLFLPHRCCVEIRTLFKDVDGYLLTTTCDSNLGDRELLIPELFGLEEAYYSDGAHRLLSLIVKRRGVVRECYTFIYDSLKRIVTKKGFVDGQPVRIDYLDYDQYGSYKKVVTTTASEESTEITLEEKDEYGYYKKKKFKRSIMTSLEKCK